MPTITPTTSRGNLALPEPETRTLGASGFWIPYMRIDPDVDETEPGGGRVLDADLESGSGYGAAVSYGGDSAGARVTFVTTDHGEEVTGGDADLYWGDLELYLGTRWDLGFVAINPQIGPGLGVAVLRLPAPFDDEWGGTLSGRGAIAFELGDRFSIDVAATIFLMGEPGETVAYGGFAALGGTVRF